MNPRDFHLLALKLVRGGGAVRCRPATSRAYYGVFNVGVEWLNPIVPLSKGSAAHGQIARLLANSGDSDLAQVGSDLGDLHSRRIDADYELNNLGAENPS